MNVIALTVLARERQAAICAASDRDGETRAVLRPMVARALRASGDRLFRLGVALEPRVSAASVTETPTV